MIKDPRNMDVRALLRQAGLRATHARMSVYEVLRDSEGHHSVDDIVGLLAHLGKRIQRMSVYNVVTDLSAAGLVMCADAGPGRALYEVADAWHHHFVCRVCKRIVDVPCMEGDDRNPCLNPPWAPGKIDEAHIIFRGVCDDCASTNPQNADG